LSGASQEKALVFLSYGKKKEKGKKAKKSSVVQTPPVGKGKLGEKKGDMVGAGQKKQVSQWKTGGEGVDKRKSKAGGGHNIEAESQKTMTSIRDLEFVGGTGYTHGRKGGKA